MSRRGVSVGWWTPTVSYIYSTSSLLYLKERADTYFRNVAQRVFSTWKFRTSVSESISSSAVSKQSPVKKSAQFFKIARVYGDHTSCRKRCALIFVACIPPSSFRFYVVFLRVKVVLLSFSSKKSVQCTY